MVQILNAPGSRTIMHRAKGGRKKKRRKTTAGIFPSSNMDEGDGTLSIEEILTFGITTLADSMAERHSFSGSRPFMNQYVSCESVADEKRSVERAIKVFMMN